MTDLRASVMAIGMLLGSLIPAACAVPPADCQLSMAGVDDARDLTIGDPLPDDAVQVVTPDDIDPTATKSTLDDGGGQGIEVRLRPKGAERLLEYTEGHVGGVLLIANHGTIVSAPIIRGAIPGGVVVLSGPKGDLAWLEGFRDCMPVEVIGNG